MKRSMETDRRNKRQMGRTVWTTAFVLMLLLIASMAGVGAVLKPVSTNEKNVIFISAGSSADYMAGTKSIAQKGGTDSAGGSAAGTGSYRSAASVNPGIIARDGNVQWETKTDVDLFADSYTNAAGETTVQSGNGDKLIAPGTTGSYKFSLKNTGYVSLGYEMSLDSLFLLKERKLPIQIRLDNGADWIVGGENDWVDSDTVQGVVEEGTLKANQYSNYTLQWRWPYEMENDGGLASNDGNDTALGSAAAKEDADFQLTITVRAEAAPETESQKPDPETEGTKPGTDPETETEGKKPGTDPDAETEDKKPGTDPETETEDKKPDTEPVIDPENQGSGTESGMEIEPNQNTMSPQTGDDTNIGAYALLLFGSGLILLMLFLCRRSLIPGKCRRRNADE